MPSEKWVWEKFFFDDFERDTQGLSPLGRGVWISILIRMWRTAKQTKGTLMYPVGDWAKVINVRQTEFIEAIGEFTKFDVCEVLRHQPQPDSALAFVAMCNCLTRKCDRSCQEWVSISCRRIVRQVRIRESNRVAQAAIRERGGGDPDRWTAIRIKILERDEYQCQFCGRKARTVDHLLPKMRGGTEDPSNLVASCKSCNMRKGCRTVEQAGMTFWKYATYRWKVEHNTSVRPEIIPPSEQHNPGELRAKSQKLEKERKIFSSDSVEIRLSTLLLELIRTRDPHHPTPNLQTWAKHIDFLIRLDGRPPELIETIVRFSQTDPFWQSNILSTKTLRDKFSTLLQKSQSTKPALVETTTCGRLIPGPDHQKRRCGEPIAPEERGKPKPLCEACRTAVTQQQQRVKELERQP